MDTQIRRNQKVIRNINIELEVNCYPKNKQPITHQPKFKPPNCPSWKRNNWLDFDIGFYCRNCGDIINEQKHQIDKKVRSQDHYFSTTLAYADKNIRKIFYSMVKTTYKSPEDMNNKLQSLKGKTKIKFYKIIFNYYDEMNIRRRSGNFQFEEDPSGKNVQSFVKIYHEVVL